MRRHFSFYILGLTALIGFVVLMSCRGRNVQSNSSTKVSYGTKVKYAEGQKIEFPDFAIEFLGEKTARNHEKYSRDEFRITKGNEVKEVSWGRDEGDIGRVKFKLGDDNYLMELIGSQTYGFMGKNVLVVWKNPAGT